MSNNAAIARPEGSRNAWNKRIFRLIGNITTVAKGTKRPERNATAQINSKIFTVGIKYTEAAIPSLKTFTLPVTSGASASLKKKAMEANA